MLEMPPKWWYNNGMEEIKITVRIPVGIADKIRQFAEDHDRSLNGEIVWALRQYAKREALDDGNQSPQDPPEPNA